MKIVRDVLAKHMGKNYPDPEERMHFQFRAGGNLLELIASDKGKYDPNIVPILFAELDDFFENLPKYRLMKR